MANRYFWETTDAGGGVYLWSEDDGGGGANSNWSSTTPGFTAAAAPVNGDTVYIEAADTCTYDEDMTGWANGVTLNIAATATLTVLDDAGSYYLMTSAHITLNGTLQAGTSTSVPFTGTFEIDFNNTSSSIVVNDATGSLLLYCIEHTLKYVTLTVANSDGTVTDPLDVDGDVSSEWGVGDTVCICDLVAPGFTTRDNEEDTIAAYTASSITLTGGLAAQKEIGSKIILITRNIRLINSTDYVVKNGTGCYVAAEIYNCNGGGFSGTDDSTIGGSMLHPSGVSKYMVVSGNGNTINAACCQDDSTGSSGLCLTAKNTNVTSASITAGSYYCVNDAYSCSFAGVMAAHTLCIHATYNVSVTGDIIGVYTGVNTSTNVWFTGTTANVTQSFNNCHSVWCGNAELGNSVGGLTSTRDFYNCGSVQCYNTLFAATTEFDGYNTDTVRTQWNYAESFNHDQIVNAYSAWVLGGKTTSQTASPPTGYDVWYELACESASYPCFRQFDAVILPGAALEVEGLIRIADAVDHSSYPPFLAIVDSFADPLVDSTKSYLDIDYVGEPDGSDSSWQTVSVIYANQGDSPKNVKVRMLAKNAAADVDTVWSVAGYQEEISMILSVVRPTNGHVSASDSATSFTVDFGQATADAYNNMTIQVQDADTGFWEERTVTDWTAGKVVTVDTAFSFTPAVDDKARITATSYGGPVDLTSILEDTNEIQGKLPDDYIMGSSVTTSMDDEINNIEGNTGKVVYGSVYTSGGVKKTIADGSTTGFVVEDEKL